MGVGQGGRVVLERPYLEAALGLMTRADGQRGHRERHLQRLQATQAPFCPSLCARLLPPPERGSPHAPVASVTSRHS